MGRFFTSTQIYNPKILSHKEFTDMFCKEMNKVCYVLCDSDESELSYILKFADNCKWVTITSESYEHGNQFVQQDTGRIAKMLKTTCVNTTVIDSDFAVLDLYDKTGKKADSLIIGRADDYFGDDISQPSEKIWMPFLSNSSTWEQFTEICNAEEIFVEDSLSKLAEAIGIDSSNILFSAEDAQEDEQTVFLYFKKAETKKEKKLTLNTAFKHIFGETLEPLGFVRIKSKHPYFVRVVNGEILHIITFDKDSNGEFSIYGGIATVYREKIDFDQDARINMCALNDTAQFYTHSFKDYSKANTVFTNRSYFYSPNDNNSIEQAFIKASEQAKQYILPVLDNIVSLTSCIEHYIIYPSTVCIDPDETANFGNNEGLIYFKIDDHSDMMQAFSKSLEITKNMIKNDRNFDSIFKMRCDGAEEYRKELISKRDAIYNEPSMYRKVMAEIEKRKIENLEKLKNYGIPIT